MQEGGTCLQVLSAQADFFDIHVFRLDTKLQLSVLVHTIKWPTEVADVTMKEGDVKKAIEATNRVEFMGLVRIPCRCYKSHETTR
jgi:hypothetical protein